MKETSQTPRTTLKEVGPPDGRDCARWLLGFFTISATEKGSCDSCEISLGIHPKGSGRLQGQLVKVLGLELLSPQTQQCLAHQQTVHLSSDTPPPPSAWAAGPGRLVKVERNMNAETHCQILEDNPTQSASELRLWRRFIFQQDRDLKHRAKSYTRRLKDNKVRDLE